MRPPRAIATSNLLLAAAAAAAALSSCAENEFARPIIATNAQSFSLCCDDSTMLPLELGTFQVALFTTQLTDLEESSITATFLPNTQL